ncbi:DNA helicase [Malassezia psittaci]|uniref:DNA helicase n=1 Tax=Malassezia psittaci TaxID=1821823 RepID=A0AAF0JFJ5_9BASI|nr:DNA helicase [Malassezia psittaci]
MSGSAQDPVVLAPDSSPSRPAYDRGSDGAPRNANDPFRQNLAAYQYHGPGAEVATESRSAAPASHPHAAQVASAPTLPVPQIPSSTYTPSDSIVQIKATRLARLFSNYTVDQCVDVLRASNYDLGIAIEKLRPKTVATPAPAPQPVLQATIPKTAYADAASSNTTQRQNSTGIPSKPPPKRAPKRKSRAMDDSDSDASIEFEGDSSEEEDAYDVDARQKYEQDLALGWFNKCDSISMVDSINCTPEQANTIIQLRPFTSVDDVYERLGDKSAKGVSPRLFTNCVELMAGYMEVDDVLAKCEAIGSELDQAMQAWQTATDRGVDESSSAVDLAEVKRDGAVNDEYYLQEQPTNLAENIVLKEYQLLGVSWLNLLYHKKISCILADEMGLGKTAQVISFLAHLKLQKNRKGPHLVIVPSSVLENWSREMRRFCPMLKVEVYYGSQAERRELRMELRERTDYDVMLTTYDMATASDDHKFFRKCGFDVCVYDEGHMLKNRRSQKYEKLMKISARWRLLLTGTPLQNNLQELISLLSFILPEYFTSAEEALSAIFKAKPGSNTSPLSQQRVIRAKRMMRPFVLRRRKDKVLLGLTKKTERVEYCEMTPSQKELYQDALQRTKSALADAEDPPSKSTKKPANRDTSNVLMDLRKAANHPLLFRRLYTDKKIASLAKDYIREPEHADENLAHLKEDFAINTDAELSLLARSWKSTQKHVLPINEWMDSGKIQALKQVIDQAREKNERILVFSQFTSMLDILCVCLEHMDVRYVGFTGQTNVGDRQHIVDHFTNDPSITVFLLSTRAGGLGINLVAANWVVLFDQDFNPQNDKQATDRCYRIGQTKPVTVVKFISRGTIDEDILALADRKLELAERVSGERKANDEGNEDLIESEIKGRIASSLLSQVRDRAAPV